MMTDHLEQLAHAILDGRVQLVATLDEYGPGWGVHVTPAPSDSDPVDTVRQLRELVPPAEGETIIDAVRTLTQQLDEHRSELLTLTQAATQTLELVDLRARQIAQLINYGQTHAAVSQLQQLADTAAQAVTDLTGEDTRS